MCKMASIAGNTLEYYLPETIFWELWVLEGKWKKSFFSRTGGPILMSKKYVLIFTVATLITSSLPFDTAVILPVIHCKGGTLSSLTITKVPMSTLLTTFEPHLNLRSACAIDSPSVHLFLLKGSLTTYLPSAFHSVFST